MSVEDYPGSPDDSQSEARVDFSGVVEGYGPFYQDLLDELGRFSVENAKAMDEHEARAKAGANLEFLKNFSNLLPHFYYYSKRGIFVLRCFEIESGFEAQYTYRQLQAQVVWANTSFTDIPPVPYFVMGESTYKSGEQNKSEHSGQSLLLLPATRERKNENLKAYRDYVPVKVNLHHEIESDREEFARSVEAMPFTENERRHVTDPKTGNLILKEDRHTRIFELSSEDIYSYAVLDELDDLDQHKMESFGVYEHLAKLAAAFQIIQPTHDLLFGKTGKQENRQTYEGLLSAQNQKLKLDIKDIMLKTQILSEEEVDRIITDRYPDISE